MRSAAFVVIVAVAHASMDPGTCVKDNQWSLPEAQLEVAKPKFAPQIQAWYVNQKDHVERSQCMSKQLMLAHLKPNRFEAAIHPKLKVGKYDEQLLKSDFKDCALNGADWHATGYSGETEREKMVQRQSAVANWCSHKRLFEQLDKSEGPEYFLVVDDAAVLDSEKLLPVLQDFIVNYRGTKWSMVQIDPFGSKDRASLIGYHRGRPVWRPQESPLSQRGSECSQYYGSHAMLVSKAGLKEALEFMRKSKAVPVDWMPFKLHNAISFGASVAQNAEKQRSGSSASPAISCPTVSASAMLEEELELDLQNAEMKKIDPQALVQLEAEQESLKMAEERAYRQAEIAKLSPEARAAYEEGIHAKLPATMEEAMDIYHKREDEAMKGVFESAGYLMA